MSNVHSYRTWQYGQLCEKNTKPAFLTPGESWNPGDSSCFELRLQKSNYQIKLEAKIKCVYLSNGHFRVTVSILPSHSDAKPGLTEAHHDLQHWSLTHTIPVPHSGQSHWPPRTSWGAFLLLSLLLMHPLPVLVFPLPWDISMALFFIICSFPKCHSLSVLFLVTLY